MRPAVNLNLSVSRVGSAAQNKVMKSISGALKLYLASYKEAQIFSAYSSDLDFSTMQLLNRGAKITELLKQKNFSPLSVDDQFIVLFAGLCGLLDEIETVDIISLEGYILEKCQQFEFYDADEKIEIIHSQLTDSLVDVINE
jgi:F0F1-type ATP synthase alpha subunit